MFFYYDYCYIFHFVIKLKYLLNRKEKFSMNKLILKSLCTILIIINTLIPTAFADEIKLDAKNAILVDMQNSMVLYDKNSTDIIQPAGFTKIVTAMVVLENCEDLSQVITAPKDTIDACDFSFGNMGILAEENLSAKAFLEGMLVYDAAEAAEVLEVGS